MAWTLAEAVADNAITYITGAQAAKLTDVAARYTTVSLPMPVFAAVRMGDPDLEGVREPSFPCLYVVPVDSRMELGVGAWRQGGWVEHQFAFFVVASHPGTATETTGETLARLTKRYAVAVLEMLAEYWDGATRTEMWGTGPEVRLSYSPVGLAATGSEYIGSAAIEIGCRVHEGAI